MSKPDGSDVAVDAPAGAAPAEATPPAAPAASPAPGPLDVVFPADGAAGAAAAAAGGAARATTLPKARKGAPKGKRGLRLPRRFKGKTPGSAAGIAPQDLAPVTAMRPTVRVSCIDYSAQQAVFEEIEDLPAFIARHRQDWSAVRWINVDGLSDLGDPRRWPRSIGCTRSRSRTCCTSRSGRRSRPTRTTATYPARLFIIARMIELRDGPLAHRADQHLRRPTTVLTFQESPGDVWDPIRAADPHAGLAAAASTTRASSATR